MDDLTKKHCVPCEGGVSKFTAEEARVYLGRVSSLWQLKGDAIEANFTLKDFKEAMAFVEKVAALAEREGHHPDVEIHWNRVKLTLVTHAIGGLSENDFILAAKIDEITKQEK